jgi:dihydrofolate synthase/folylpolyglutamate synthase
MTLDEALAYLEDHINLEALLSTTRIAPPTLGRITQLMQLMDEPQRAYPVLHLTGTNGKGSTARILSSLVAAAGLSVGTYTSPDLERVNERLSWNGEPISDGALAEVIEAIAQLESLMDAAPSRFEILTAAAYRWFADIAVDVAVVEVGLGGRWDATNVADGAVAVVTNVSLDHAELLGDTLEAIATEKSGIVKPGSTLVLGETTASLAAIFRGAGAERVWQRGEDYECTANRVAHGGRLVSIRTPGATYDDVFLPLHGAHQGENAACALAAAEAFFDAPLGDDVVAEAFAAVQNPGRMEVMGHRPLTLVDGAHNPAGARAAAVTLADEFTTIGRRVFVVGLLKGREPGEMLAALGVTAGDTVIACAPPSPRALDPAEVAAAARALGADAEVAPGPAPAVTRAFKAAQPDDVVMVVGSLYLVGAARPVVAAAVAARPPATDTPVEVDVD